MLRTNLFTNNETKIDLTLKQQIGPDDNIRFRGTDPYTFDSVEGFNKGLTTMHNMLCKNIERFYDAMKKELFNTSMNETDKEETRQFNSIKFEFEICGKLNGNEINEKFTKLSDLLAFSKKYDINPSKRILDILNFSDETSGCILFYPEREPMRFCNII